MAANTNERGMPSRGVKLPLEIDIITDGRPKHAGDGTTINLSPAGATVKTELYLRVGQLVRMRIQGSKKTIETLGRVHKVNSTRDHGFLVEVKFAQQKPRDDESS